MVFLMHDNDDNDDQVTDDIYGNANRYQCHCMDVSGELMTFCVGGPRYFKNNLPLENSPLWKGRNLATSTYHRDVFRDCKYVYGSPLFRWYYEFPMNPSLCGPVIEDVGNWWDIEDQDSNIFEDADDYGYMAAQLSHLPKCIGYDVGNLLSYMPIYDLHVDQRVLYYKKQIELTPPKVLSNFLCQSRTLPFKFRSDEVAVAQCNVLHDPSVYIISRKSLIVNKPHMFYNDDSSDMHCLPLNKNVLKWSEGFMGDCMTIFLPVVLRNQLEALL